MSPTYPTSTNKSGSDYIAYQDNNELRNDAIYLGGYVQGETQQSKTLAELLAGYQSQMRLQYLATNKVKINPYTTACIVIDGYLLTASLAVNLASAISGAAGIKYIYAKRTAGSTTFTLTTDGSSGSDCRAIGELYFDGSNVVQDSIKSYFENPNYVIDYSIKQRVNAWVKAGTGGAIIASFNIASVVKNATGSYTITFAETFDHADYICVIIPDSTVYRTAQVYDAQTTNCTIYTYNSTFALADSKFHLLIIGGKLA